MFRLFPVFLSLLALVPSAHAQLALSGAIDVSSRPPSDGVFQWGLSALPDCVITSDCHFQFALRGIQNSTGQSPYIEIRLGKRANQGPLGDHLTVWIVTRDGSGQVTHEPTAATWPWTSDPANIGANWQYLLFNLWHIGTNEQVRILVRDLRTDQVLIDAVRQVPGLGDTGFYRKQLRLDITAPDAPGLFPLRLTTELPAWTRLRVLRTGTSPLALCALDVNGRPFPPLLAFFDTECGRQSGLRAVDADPVDDE